MKRNAEKRAEGRCGRWLLLLLAVLFAAAGFAPEARAEVPAFVQKGFTVYAYTWQKGSLKVYKDSSGKEVREEIEGDNVRFGINGYEGRAFHVTYTLGGKSRKGWIPMKRIQASLKTEKKDALLRYATLAYRRPSGDVLGTIPAYTDVDILGKKSGWYQVSYLYKKRHYIAWITETSYKSGIRVFDGSEERLMAEGVYTIRINKNRALSLAVQNSALTTASTGKSSSQRFEFRFAGENCYQILHNGTNLALTAEKSEEGKYTGDAILSELSAREDIDQIWQLIRVRDHYFLKNKGTGQYLTVGKPFSTKAYKSSRTQRFRIVMVGKNTSHWQVFSQYDSRWAALKYGKTNTMAASACGVFSSVNAVYALNGQFMDPVVVADYAVKTGYRVEGSGTDYRFVQAAANHFGKTYGYAFAGSTMSLSKLKSHLQSGGTAVVYVPHHYIAVSEYKDGKYLVLDPYATDARATSPFGCWVSGSRFQSGTLMAQNFLLLKATN